MSDDHHEAYGAMIFRGLEEQRTYQKEQEKKALHTAMDALVRIGWDFGYEQEGTTAFEMQQIAIEAANRIRRLTK